MAHTAMLWRRLDAPGHDAARLSAAAGVCLAGATAFIVGPMKERTP